MDLFGHRGARHEAPENTLAGFAHLRSLGLHRVELDVRLSADGQAVVIHDETVDRTTAHITDKTGHVLDFTAKELASLGVPTLESVLAAWPELQVVQLEIKTAPEAVLRSIFVNLQTLVELYRLADIGVITSFSQDALRLAAEYVPMLARGFLFETPEQDPVATAKALGCQQLIVHHPLCDRALVTAAHAAHLSVCVWTVNDPVQGERFRAMGVDGLITDVPSQFLAIQKNEQDNCLASRVDPATCAQGDRQA